MRSSLILVGLVLVQFGSRWVGSRFGFGFGSGWRQALPKARQRRVGRVGVAE